MITPRQPRQCEHTSMAHQGRIDFCLDFNLLPNINQPADVASFGIVLNRALICWLRNERPTTRWLITTDVTVLWQLAGAIKPQRLPRRPRAEFRELARQHRGFRSTGSWILATDTIAIFTGFGSTIFYEESWARAVWGLRNINTRNWIRNFIDLQQQKGGCGWVTWVLSR